MIKYLNFTILMTILILICLAFFCCKAKEKTFHIGVLQWTEDVEAFNQAYKGVIEGLKGKGYLEGINLTIDYQNVEQDKGLALKAAREFVDKRVDLIVALGSGSSLAALDATKDDPIPIVFSNAGAPEATGIIKDYDDSGRNITGVTMTVPVREQFGMVKEALPELKKVGIIYCTETSVAVATGKEATAVAHEFGWKQSTIFFPAEKLPDLPAIVKSLAQDVDAIYISSDPVLGSPEYQQTIIRVCDEHKIPAIYVTEKTVADGILMAVHCDFYGIGRQSANLIAQVLDGVDVRMIPVQRPIIKRLSLNLEKARELQIKIRRNAILKADNIFD